MGLGAGSVCVVVESRVWWGENRKDWAKNQISWWCKKQKKYAVRRTRISVLV